MRITNDNYSPIELLAELTTRGASTSSDTKRFFTEERAKHDWLVEAFASRIEALFDSFKRYGHDVNETQFIRDQGVDVLVCVPDHQGRSWRLGLQVKSELEAQRDKTRKPGQESMIATLKRQGFEAAERVDEWWVLPCFDLTKHHALAQAISSEIAAPKQLLQRKVLDARNCQTLLSMTIAEVDAYCSIFLCRHDEVLASAREEASRLHRVVAKLVIENLHKGLDGEPLQRDELIGELHDAVQVERDRRERLVEDARSHCLDDRDSIDEEEDRLSDGEDLVLEELHAELERCGFFSIGTYSDKYQLVPTAFPGLCALFFEARVRHALSGDAAIDYISWLVLDPQH